MLSTYSTADKVLLALDCIIFGFDQHQLKILLIKRDFEPEKGKWSLIGGFLKRTETLDEAANRILQHLSGLDDIYLEQLYTFSEVDRDPGERTLSTAYYALINSENHTQVAKGAYSAQWFNIEDAPNLIFDHGEMVEKAILRLRRRAVSKPIGFELLPEKFTMLQLQKLYEAILDEKLDKRNFINKVNALDILIKLDEKDMTSSRKGSYLYQFDKQKYDQKIEEGFTFKL
ncbi:MULTISPECIES: NUDIX domain-containing protein [unclassified Leeuwenhoekiella]|uniref:NUDIX hydrolase n=1 Tax=unclassified Leeuwenhoekiella TaxID=2615029 RepID=UPI000C68EFFB|nr:MULTISPECIES: NUDIX domain-containing protein [unclassified Leeuwenhoekiella]MAW94855.1 DNA mismatch repair protein MutT [Leeuwenhoekiella sp.]MBA79575.1 DNA mismatch repair protein MutT [Leeuwenhoekiella sp.]|tara:strand:- start:19242 stop:19931 length:690 start_codon:yes stop_codon:yes gene_type:complete